MKKVMMMIALLAIPFAMQAQTKFHDLEVNDAKGPVKSITTTMMGMSRTIGWWLLLRFPTWCMMRTVI